MSSKQKRKSDSLPLDLQSLADQSQWGDPDSLQYCIAESRYRLALIESKHGPRPPKHQKDKTNVKILTFRAIRHDRGFYNTNPPRSAVALKNVRQLKTSLGSSPYPATSHTNPQNQQVPPRRETPSYLAETAYVLRLDVWSEGSIAEVYYKRKKPLITNSDAPKNTPSKRGEVTTLRPSARRRLSAYVAKLKRDAPCHFISLTYAGNPENWDESQHEPLPGPRQAKNELRAYAKRIKRRFPDFAFVWKLEPQQRGVPHFHLLAYGLPDDPHAMHELRMSWHEMTGRGQHDHIEHGFDAEYLGTDSEKARRYVSKYVSKDEIAELDPDHGAYEGSSPGRFWGREFPQALPISKPDELQVERHLAPYVLRVLRRLQSAQLRTGYLARVEKYSTLKPDGLREIKKIRCMFHKWKTFEPDRWKKFPSYSNPFKRTACIRNNFSADPRRYIDRILLACVIATDNRPPDKLAGPLGRLP